MNLLQYYLPGSSLLERPVNVFGTARTRLIEDQGGGRIDVALTSKQTLFGQYIETRSRATQGVLFPLAGNAFPHSSRFMMLQHTWGITPAVVATMRLGFVRNQALRSNEARDLGPILTEIGIQNTFDNRGVTSITLQTFTGFGQATGDSGNVDNNYQLNYGLHYLRGKHDIQFGAGVRYRRTWQQNANSGAHGLLFFQPNYTAQLEPAGEGRFRPLPATGNDFADFLLGIPSQGQMAGLPQLAYRSTQYMPYLQDTWKIQPGLTLNYGVGWFLETVPDPRGRARDWAHGFDWSTGLLTYAALGQVDPGIVRRDANNFAPRFGFAWSPRFLPRTVIRAGAGIYYAETGLTWLTNATLAPPFSTPFIISVDPLNPTPAFRLDYNVFPPAAPPQLHSGFAAALPNGTAARVLHAGSRTPIIQQWNVSLHAADSRELPR